VVVELHCSGRFRWQHVCSLQQTPCKSGRKFHRERLYSGLEKPNQRVYIDDVIFLFAFIAASDRYKTIPCNVTMIMG
jgi:hypothetical protein